MENLLLYMIKNLALLGLFLGVYLLWLYPRKQFIYNRFFMLFGLLASFVLPLIEIKKIVIFPWRPLADASYISLTAASSIPPSFNWLYLCGSILILGSLILFVWFEIRLGAIYNILLKATVVAVEKPKLLISTLAKSPFSFLNSIVFPKHQYKGPNYQVILAHEKIHVQQRHSIDLLLVHLWLIVGWWNPLLWWYKKALIENLEFIAYAATVSITKEAKAYQYILLEQTVPLAQLSLVHPFYHSFLKKRIMMLNNNSPKKSPVASLILLPLLAVFVMLFNTKVVAQIAPPPPPIMAPPPPPVMATKAAQEENSFSEMSISVTIEASTTDQELSYGYLNLFNEQGVNLRFKKIKRNLQGLITSISASYKSKNGKSGTYAVSGNDPIKPFKFYINLNDTETITEAGFKGATEHSLDRLGSWDGNINKDSLMVGVFLEEGQEVAAEEKTKFLVTTVKKTNEKNFILNEKLPQKQQNKKSVKMTINKLVFTDKDSTKVILIDADTSKNGLVFINGKSVSNDTLSFDYEDVKDLDFDLVQPGNRAKSLGGITASEAGIFVINTKKDPEGTSKIVVKKNTDNSRGEEKEKPLIVINGTVQAINFDMTTVKPAAIESISVLKGAAAKKKYGEKGVNGVIEIVTKNK